MPDKPSYEDLLAENAALRAENAALRQQVADLTAQLAAVTAQLAEVRAQLAAALAEIDRLKRDGKRQATPFSKGPPKSNPKRPGRKPGQGPFRFRAAPAPEAITASRGWNRPTTGRSGPCGPG